MPAFPPPAAASSSLLARASYDPVSFTQYTTSSATDADVDAANLSVTVPSVPASGVLLVRLTAECDVSTNAKNHLWTVREGSSTIAGPAVATNVSNGGVCASRVFVITGLTPGSSHTYKWGFQIDSAAASAHIYVGGGNGPGVMEVWAG